MKRPVLAASLGLLAACPGPARAGSSSSANYTVVADTVASAGQRSTSDNYTADQSLADFGSAGTSAGSTLLQGYTGQLYDPASLTLTATPPAVSELAASQLSAVSMNDDGTSAPVPASEILWSIVSGPVLQISTSGLVTTGAVYADSTTGLSGQWRGLTGLAGLTILDTDPDNYHNYAGDGVPDAWQVSYFGPDNPNGEAGADPDADGQDNAFEYRAGLLPNDASSWFNIAMSTAGPTRRDIEFGPVVSGRSYRLQWSSDLVHWRDVASPLLISDDGHQRILQDSEAREDRKFYRIEITVD